MKRILAVVLVLVALAAAWWKHYSIDEFQYSHAAWLVARGAIPYVDFFEFHHPLPYQLGALVMLPLPDDPEAIRWMRMLNLLPLGALLYGLTKWTKSTVILCALGTYEFTTLATEFRPDVLALAYFTLAIAALHDTARSDRRAAVTAGLCAAIAVWSSQKAILYGVVFAIAFVHDVLKPTKLLRDPKGFVMGFAALAALCAVYLVSTGSAGEWFRQCYVWAAYHEREYPGFSVWTYLAPTLAWNVPLFGFAAYGVWKRRDFWIIGALVCTLGSFLKAKAPFPYALVPFLAIVAAAAAPVIRKEVLAVIVVIGVARLIPTILDTNAHQHATLKQLATLTNTSDPVFDSSGQATARLHIGHRFYTSALIRYKEADWLTEHIPKQLEAQGCTATMLDLRYSGLSAELKTYIEAHFQPYTPDLWLWGMRTGATITVPRTARYFVTAPVTIDGATVTGEIDLTKGEHPTSGDAWLLWLPRNGEHWTPGTSRAGTFSHLF